jgi:MYXO-CTERM domain-containing protein
MVRRSAVSLGALLGAWLWSGSAQADDVPADPSDYQDKLAALQPGDTLVLEPGEYPRLTISGLHGTADAWITIAGPTSGDPAIITSDSCCNTVQLYDSSFIAIQNLVVDAQGLYVDGINAKDSISHDILIENNTLRGFPEDQQIVGISTKSPAYNWTIRGNTIIEAGTGLYLGNSDGSQPFVNGVIEYNLVLMPLGYCMQIKHQNDYTAAPGMPEGPNTTIIRHNAFIKDDRPSPDGDRPNLLVGGFPDTGPGAEDRYQIYGNLLVYNPREALIQASGRVSIHDNIFVGAASSFPALALTSHEGKAVELAHVYNNTIFTSGTGISLSSAATEDDAVVGNLVFAATPISGSIADLRDNIEATEAEAGKYVAMPGTMFGAMDFYPLPGAAEGEPLDLGKFVDDADYDVDYNRTAKADFRFRGAYAGAGDNPCPLDQEIKNCDAAGDDTGGSDGGSDAGTDTTDPSAGGTAGNTSNASDDGSTGGGTMDGSAGSGSGDAAEGDGGCGCTSGGSPPLGLLPVLVLAFRRRVRAA